MFVLGAYSIATAETIQLELNCYISGGSCIDDGTIFGTVTLNDDVIVAGYSAIEITIELEGDHKVLEISLNYDDTFFSNLDEFKLTNVKSGNTTTTADVKVDEDHIKLQSYDGFDLTSKVGLEDSWVGTLYLTGTDLNISMFNYSTGVNSLLAALHIGDYNNPYDNSDSITVGALPSNPVPEPATAALFFTGIACITGLKRKIPKNYKNQAFF